MSSDPELPPQCRLLKTQPDADLRAVARRLAGGGEPPGTMLWSPRSDRFQAAMVLAPDEPLRVAALAVYLGMLAMGDALGSTIPAGIDVTFIWPNRINLNGGMLGAVVLEVPPMMAPEATPEWLALSFDLALSDGSAMADTKDSAATTLAEEGCGAVSSGDLLEALARHALVWSNRWHDDGFAPLRPVWLRRLEDDHDAVDLDDDGNLVVTRDGETRTVGLLDALGCLEPGEAKE
jgi:biotin-(acetyl-CoA carboxylase) ligase